MQNVRVIVETSYVENDDGKYETGSSDYCVAYISLAEAAKGKAYLFDTYVQPSLANIEVAADDAGYAYTEYLSDWSLLFDGELTYFEQMELEHDGRIDYPAKNQCKDYAGAWLPIDTMTTFLEKKSIAA